MPMKTYTPRVIQEISSSEIGFTDGDSQLDRPFNVNTVMPVTAVATSVGNLLLTEGSRSLVFRDFGIENSSTVVGIELALEVTRLARVQDKTVQIWYDGQILGKNQATLTAADLHVYGSPTDLWSAANVDYTSDRFGIIIDLQPHTQYPSSNTVYLRQLTLRLYTA